MVHQLAPWWAALMALLAFGAALAALDPQLAPAGVALVGLVVPAAASLGALDPQ